MAELAEDCVPPLLESRAFGLVERAVGVQGDGVGVVSGVGRAGDEEDARGRVVRGRDLEGLAGEGDDGVAGGCHDFPGFAGLRVVGDCPDAAREDVGGLLQSQVRVDAVDAAGLNLTLRKRELGAGREVDGADDDAVRGGDGGTGLSCFCWLRLDAPVLRKCVTS